MSVQTDLWTMERQFWERGARFYHANLTDNAVMIFPEPVGMLDREKTIQSVSDAPRWVDVELSDSHLIQLHPEMAVLTYQVAARRQDDQDAYAARVVSIYRKTPKSWKLAYHQQIPSTT